MTNHRDDLGARFAGWIDELLTAAALFRYDSDVDEAARFWERRRDELTRYIPYEQHLFSAVRAVDVPAARMALTEFRDIDGENIDSLDAVERAVVAERIASGAESIEHISLHALAFVEVLRRRGLRDDDAERLKDAFSYLFGRRED